MSFGKMVSFLRIVESTTIKDEEGYSTSEDRTVAAIRAYKESRHGSEVWKNRSAFSEATCLFRFRKIPSTTITTSHFIICDNVRYRIISVEDMRERHAYLECMADVIKPTVR